MMQLVYKIAQEPWGPEEPWGLSKIEIKRGEVGAINSPADPASKVLLGSRVQHFKHSIKASPTALKVATIGIPQAQLYGEPLYRI